jgi:hypothetical protein
MSDQLTAAQVYQQHIDRIETLDAGGDNLLLGALRDAVLQMLYISRNADEFHRADREQFMRDHPGVLSTPSGETP